MGLQIHLGIVEDERQYLELLKKHLSHLQKDSENHKLDITTHEYILENGSEDILALLHDDLETLDILLIDYEMPQYTGDEIVNMLKRHAHGTKMLSRPIFILNSKYSEDDSDLCVKGMLAGADDCVTFDKYDFKNLMQLLEEYAQKREKMAPLLRQFQSLQAAGAVL